VSTTAHHDVLASEPDQFRHAQTGLDSDGQQGPIAAADPRRQVGRGEDGRDLRRVEERNGFALVAFAGHREDLLAQQRMGRLSHRDIPKERMNRGQTRIAGPTAVAALLLQVLEKSPDERGREILCVQPRRGLAQLVGRKPEEQSKRIAIPGDRMGLACRCRSKRSVKKPCNSDWKVAAIMA
jgi:hypothetical protein